MTPDTDDRRAPVSELLSVAGLAGRCRHVIVFHVLLMKLIVMHGLLSFFAEFHFFALSAIPITGP